MHNSRLAVCSHVSWWVPCCGRIHMGILQMNRLRVMAWISLIACAVVLIGFIQTWVAGKYQYMLVFAVAGVWNGYNYLHTRRLMQEMHNAQ